MISIATLALTLALQSGGTTPKLLRLPDISGDNVVFSRGGDLWLAQGSGSLARQLTSHPGLETRPHFSPDGKWIAFTGMYDGGNDVYVMPATGGEPKRLTYGPDASGVVGWTPDGKIAYVSTTGSFSNRQRKLWLVKPDGGLPIDTPVAECAEASFSPDGNQIAYDRQTSLAFNWRGYRGGSQGVVSIFDLKKLSYKEIPHDRENQWSPVWVGRKIYFLSDKVNNTTNVFVYDVDSGDTSRVTDYKDEDIKSLSGDNNNLVFEHDGDVITLNVASRKTSHFEVAVNGDNPAARPVLRNLAPQIESGEVSPKGARVLYEARGVIFSVPAKKGDTRVFMQKDGVRYRKPQWSPDGKTVVFLSDEGGKNQQIYSSDPMGANVKQLTQRSGSDILGYIWSDDSKSLAYETQMGELHWLNVSTGQDKLVLTQESGQAAPFAISPDGKWVAVLKSSGSGFSSIALYDVEKGTLNVVDNQGYAVNDLTFDKNGKYIYFTSVRTVNPTPSDFELELYSAGGARIYSMILSKDTPDPFTQPNDEEGAAQSAEGPAGPPSVKVDLDGIASRVVALPMPAGNYNIITGLNNGVLFAADGAISKFDFASQQAQPVISGAQGVSINANATQLLYWNRTSATTGVTGVVPLAGPPAAVGAGRVDTSQMTATVNPRAEWSQMFWESWRFERDNYYDTNMHGLDWNAVGNHYASLLPSVTHRAELTTVLGLMIGEFGTSHSYVQGGEMGVPAPVPVGQLGVDYEVVGDAVRLKKIYHGESFEEARRGPLGEPGVNVAEGSYLLAIDGTPVNSRVDPRSLMVGKSNRYVTLTVNSTPSMDGAKKVRIKPVGNETQLRYESWVEANRAYVDKMSGGKIGYMHVPNTGNEGMIEFIKAYYAQAGKDAMIIDERFNGGGYIPTFFIERLSRRVTGAFQQRGGVNIPLPGATAAPLQVMLINGYAGSGGDMLPYLFRSAGLGPLIGKRTWGGLVGINGGDVLLDGGTVTSPRFRIFDPNTHKWIAENEGISPDIDVDARPDLVAKGLDPQLDAAIKNLIDRLKGYKPVDLTPPAIPTHNRQ